MPNIREYNSPENLGLQPSDRGPDATAAAARRIGGFYNQVSDAYSTAASLKSDLGRRISSTISDAGDVAVKYMDHREISHGAATYATAFAGLDQQWNEITKTADPNDPTVAAKFREEVLEPGLQKFREGFTTENSQKWAESAIDGMRNHFFTKTSADMSTMAGRAVRQNIETLTNQLSNAAINDPSSVKTSLAVLEHSIGAMVDSSPNLRGTDAQAVKSEVLQTSQTAVVKAAAVGAIGANPEAGLKQYSSPEYSKYISGAELKSLEQQARAVIRAQHADENFQRQNKERAIQDASDEREGQYLAKLHSDDPREAAQVSARAIANDFTLNRAARERMVGIVERETKPEAAAKVSNATAADLVSRVRLPIGDPNRIDDLSPIYDAYEKGRLNKGDLKFVRDEFANIRTPEGEALGKRQSDFVDSVKPLIDKSNPLMGRVDASGHQQVYLFTRALADKIADYRRTGKNPYDLMDPSKPDFMGTPAALLQYQKPIADSIRDIAANLRRGAASGLPAAETITGVQTVTPPVATSVPRPPPAKPPEKGFVKDGYEFLGGNPGEAANWRKVGA